MQIEESSWCTVPLRNILSNEQIEEAVSIWKNKGPEETKEYFRKMKDELARKGIDADYLFYAFEIFVTPSLN